MDGQLLKLQTELASKGLLICFTGKLTQGIIEELGEAVKKYLETEERLKADVYDIFSIFIEQTQNIKNYCNSKEGADLYEQIAHSCIVTIGKTETGNYVCSGNRIGNEDIGRLKAALDEIQPLGKAELKALYKTKLKQSPPADSAGAGIGLIDMARKASRPLEYSIAGIDDKVSFFTLRAEV
ncbi:SiaB family protein kinase [Paenibacillus hamazuiensis]|uniref:SiaB family protein kinase n=1 Tax=Paenibacillus hamazuiensis TaxID=2936508 RepID=UPI0020106852|nr:SiaB family protein kinase [Paenibacillus hamazuiensis]